MILGSLTSWGDQSKYENTVIVTAMDELKKILVQNPAAGRVEINGDLMYASFMEFDAKASEDHLAEKHESYIDLQYLIEGEETIGWSSLREDVEPVKAYDSEQDYALYKPSADEILLHLKPGMFAVFFPNDIHRPGMGQPSTKIKKAVVKMHMDLLQRR
ncbi:YhcH/YjgK/YiaL family protein [Bacillus sp. FJAT-28004]|uniref:YhcH/YjgK/YiaL family protein n=1 Tax=Bacillus sp. FJAT-28004 TaxID=1679165 RepID=UPI0006B4660E|nr:YhcH/YjgK/YiaL family protein [Bacillus sp. FJAT-28004]